MTSPPLFIRLPLAALCAGLLVPACSPNAPEDVASETVVPVATEAAQIGDIQSTIHATGTITPAPGAELLVVAPEPARIAEIARGEGDAVMRGDVLVRFDIPSATAEVARQRAERMRAQAELENARAAQVRARELFERGVAARKEVEDADRDVAAAQAAIAQAQAALDGAEAAAGRAVVRAPFNGVVARRFHNPGDLVEATASDPILRVIDPRRLEVTASISIADVQRVAVGATARLTGAAGAVPLRVISRPAAVEQGTASVPIRLAFASPSATWPVGVPVQVDIAGEEHHGVVLVSASAVVHEGEESAVFVAAGNKAQRRIVMLGIVNDEHAEVRSGLKAGERVIVRGQAGLPDGATITTDAPEKGEAAEKP